MKRSTAFRFADLIHDEQWPHRLREVIGQKKAILQALYADGGKLDAEQIVSALTAAAERLRPYIADCGEVLHHAVRAGRSILFEGANGILLDVDHGSYPYVTSSGTGPFAVGSGAGFPPAKLERVVGVTKAYATRVGSGPFPTELQDEWGERIRRQGREYGTTTGRPRRCGWFDAVLMNYAVELCAPTDVALMHLDTLSGFEQVGLCTAYRCDGRTLARPPAHVRIWERCEPVIEFLPGWKDNLRGTRRFEDLPAAARYYVQRIESRVGVPVSLIGVGPERSETIVRGPLQQTLQPPRVSSNREPA
jgi:adenylosuccinate synthase